MQNDNHRPANEEQQRPCENVSFAVRRAREGGYVIMLGGDGGEFAAARSSLGEVAQWIGNTLGATFTESPLVAPQQSVQAIMTSLLREVQELAGQQPRPPAQVFTRPPQPPQHGEPIERFPNIATSGPPEPDPGILGILKERMRSNTPAIAAWLLPFTLLAAGLLPHA